MFFLFSAIFSNKIENEEKFGVVLAIFIIVGFWLFLGISLINSNFAVKQDIKLGIKFCGEFYIEQKKIVVQDEGENKFLLYVRVSNDKINLAVKQSDFEFIDLHEHIHLEFLPKSKQIICISYKNVILEKPSV